jgi:hypothetical protein
MKYVVGVTVMVVLWLSFCSRLHACSCYLPPTPQEALQNANVVFRGIVTKVEDVEDEESADYRPIGKRIVFHVGTVWKGPHEKELIILTGSGGGDCGFEFVVAGDYLVYAYADKKAKGYYTDVCTRTRDVAWLTDSQNAQEDFQALGLGTPITQ